MAPANIVCSRCWRLCFSTSEFREICQGKGTDLEGVRYSIEASYISRQAAKDCVWCSLIKELDLASRDIIPPGYRGDLDQVQVLVLPGLPFEIYTPKGNNRLEITVNGCPASFTIIAEENELVSNIVTARPVCTDIISESTFGAIDAWLTKCSRHIECGHPSDSPLPTRLIDVGSDDQQVRVVTTKGTRGRYVALSYCWGGAQLGMTREESLPDRLQHINFDELSETVRQAVQTTRRMGLQYIWIDAICIIQDNEDDRASEIAQMCDIYRRAYVTIVAANAAQSSEGFLRTPSTSSIMHKVPFWSTKGELSIAFLKLEGHYDDSSEPINTRCWTLQERLLSRRLVIFASHTIQLQCQHEIVNIGNSINIPSGVSSLRLPTAILHSNKGSVASGIGQHEIMDFWKLAITMYSERNIKRTEERLTALSGLTHSFHQALNLPYLAGLWSGESLPSMLLWNGDYDSRQPTYKTYIGPSWSWVSHPGRIRYPNFHSLPTMKAFDLNILSATTELQNNVLKFGKVTSGRIVLRARIQRASFIPPNGLLFKDYVGTPPRPLPPRDGVYGPDFVMPDCMTNAKLNRDSPAQATEFLSIGLVSRTYDWEGIEYTAIDGLLVRPTKKENPTEYYRVGCFYGAMKQEFESSVISDIALV